MNAFAKEISERSGQDLSRCYQCGKCSAGCPSVEWFDWPNHGVIRKIQLGAKDELLKSHAIWMCVGCETCGTRCPNDIYISQLMDALRNMALEEGVKPAEPAVMTFHKAFTGSVSRFGRVHELSMLMEYKLKSKDYFSDLGAGMKLFAKGKIPFMLPKVKGKGELDTFFKNKGKG